MEFVYIKERPLGEEKISLGEISFSEKTQSTYLASCLSLIVHSPLRKIGGISHIVGSIDNMRKYEFNLAGEAIEGFRKLLIEHQVYDPHYYLIGGTNRGIHVTRKALEQIYKANIYIRNRDPLTGEITDILGDKYRDICLDPAKEILLVREYSPEDQLATSKNEIEEFYENFKKQMEDSIYFKKTKQYT